MTGSSFYMFSAGSEEMIKIEPLQGGMYYIGSFVLESHDAVEHIKMLKGEEFDLCLGTTSVKVSQDTAITVLESVADQKDCLRVGRAWSKLRQAGLAVTLAAGLVFVQIRCFCCKTKGRNLAT